MATAKKSAANKNASKKASAAPGPAPAAAAYALPSLDDLKKLTERFTLPGVDLSALADWQRKDLETLAEAHRQAYEGIKAIVERRNEILRETLVQWQSSMKDVAGKDAIAKRSEAAREGVAKAIEHFREVSEMENQARMKVWTGLESRLQENMANLQKLMQPR